jgi:hypothetical protein
MSVGRGHQSDPPLIGSGALESSPLLFNNLHVFPRLIGSGHPGEIMSKLAVSASSEDARLMDLGFAAYHRGSAIPE